jgi:hypothetical protein
LQRASLKGGENVFSFDVSGLMTAASTIFSGLAPIAALVGGLLLGIGFFRFLLKELRNII